MKRFCTISRFLQQLSFVILIIISASISLGLIYPIPVSAQGNVTLFGTVKNNTGTPFPDTEIQVIDPTTPVIIASVLTDSIGHYDLAVSPGTYDVKAIPPANSGFNSLVTLAQVILTDTELNFVLVPQGGVTLSGHVLDRMDNGIPNLQVYLWTADSSAAVWQSTDASGSYSFAVPPGDYFLYIYGGNSDPTIGAPRSFSLTTSNFSLTQNTLMDIVLPVEQVSVHVQDPAGGPVENVSITTNGPSNHFTLGTLSAFGYSAYGGPIETDANGDAILWLFPTDPNVKYVFTATPPAGSGYVTFFINDVVVSSDMSMVIVLESATPPNQPPIAICQNVTVTTTSNCTASASINNGSYDPDGDQITLAYSPAAPYSLGDTTVTLIVTDDKGASDSCEAKVTVVDNTPPTISGVSASPSVLWPPNHKMVDVRVNYNVTDNCGASCSLRVASNEPINGTGDGDTSPDWLVLDPHHVQLRAERAGNGAGRIYTITVTCADSANSSSQAVTVSVPHDQGKK